MVNENGLVGTRYNKIFKLFLIENGPESLLGPLLSQLFTFSFRSTFQIVFWVYIRVHVSSSLSSPLLSSLSCKIFEFLFNFVPPCNNQVEKNKVFSLNTWNRRKDKCAISAKLKIWCFCQFFCLFGSVSLLRFLHRNVTTPSKPLRSEKLSKPPTNLTSLIQFNTPTTQIIH